MERTERYNLMCQAFLNLTDAEECADLFENLCTDKELSIMANRFLVAKMLKEHYSYDEIEKHTHISSATIAKLAAKITSDCPLNKALDRLEITGKWDDTKL